MQQGTASDRYKGTRQQKSNRKNTDDSQLRHAKTKERHLELSARASASRGSLAEGRGTDKLAVACRTQRRLAQGHSSRRGRRQVEGRSRSCHRYSEDDGGLAHFVCQAIFAHTLSASYFSTMNPEPSRQPGFVGSYYTASITTPCSQIEILHYSCIALPLSQRDNGEYDTAVS